MATTIARITSEKWGTVSRILHPHMDGPYVIESAPLRENGRVDETEFTGIGGGPGLPSGEYKTLAAALHCLAELEDVPDEGTDHEAKMWAVFEKWDGR